MSKETLTWTGELPQKQKKGEMKLKKNRCHICGKYLGPYYPVLCTPCYLRQIEKALRALAEKERREWRKELVEKIEKMKKVAPNHICNLDDWCLLGECEYNRALNKVLELLKEK